MINSNNVQVNFICDFNEREYIPKNKNFGKVCKGLNIKLKCTMGFAWKTPFDVQLLRIFLGALMLNTMMQTSNEKGLSQQLME